MIASLPVTSAQFFDAQAELRAMPWRPELHVEEIPAPGRLAPHSMAISADVLAGEEEIGSGRLVILFDPQGNIAWDGVFRCVAFAKAEVDLDMVTDPLLAEVGWSWLEEALERHGAHYISPSGAVTAQFSRSFGTISDTPSRAEIEIRASWTPEITQTGLQPHLHAWADLLCTTAGLPALPPGVISLSRRHRYP